MAKQGDTSDCTRVGCSGTMTWHEKLLVEPGAEPPVRPSEAVSGKPDYYNSGWLCSANPLHVDWDKP